jgi:hypothetical protein
MRGQRCLSSASEMLPRLLRHPQHEQLHFVQPKLVIQIFLRFQDLYKEQIYKSKNKQIYI